MTSPLASMEINREAIQLGPEIGHGEFGVVLRATANDASSLLGVTEIAVKLLKRKTESTGFR